MVTVPVEQITAEARRVKFSHVALVLFLGLFWGIGWLAGRFILGLVICAISVRRGWRDAYGYEPKPSQGPPQRS